MKKSDEILLAIDEAATDAERGELRTQYRLEIKNELMTGIKKREAAIKAIDSKLSGKVSDDVASYEIWTDLGKRRIDKVSMRDLMALRKIYVTELSKLKEKLGEMRGIRSRQVLVRF